ncbi:alcohol dehydrogenase catalytic domain-containing protein [Pseudomonas aeruginosa]|uniref:alcohol dehydrogenase catalytic domain-containing protein n=1 Tax=Pseudomonas aeruginosa TaxID=287 RepID=UPI00071BB04B|nr:formaldehyde dehydrogenase, glutathione-independent [Pseudomonas aeruginosa]
MSGNRGVVYLGPGKVEVQNIPYPKMQDPQGRQIDHGVILRVVSTNICGSDQHMVRGRTTAPEGLVLGHEITGEVVEIGRGVETMKIGDLVSVPFNVACGHCRTCKEQHTGVCLTVNPARAGGAYGYVDMGGWVGGQAEYVLVPYADFNLLKLPNREAEVDGGGAADHRVRPVEGDAHHEQQADHQVQAAALHRRDEQRQAVNPTRLAHAKKQGFEIADLSKDTPLHEQIAALLGEPEVDCAVDAVGFEARGHGHSGSQQEAPATVLNSLMGITRVAGKIGIPGLYVTEDPGAVDAAAKHGALSIRFGLGWAKSHSFHTGQTPVMKYNRQLMQAIMWDRIKIADIVGVEVITLDDAPKGYGEFDAGVPKKFVIDPHNLFRAA